MNEFSLCKSISHQNNLTLGKLNLQLDVIFPISFISSLDRDNTFVIWLRIHLPYFSRNDQLIVIKPLMLVLGWESHRAMKTLEAGMKLMLQPQWWHFTTWLKWAIPALLQHLWFKDLFTLEAASESCYWQEWDEKKKKRKVFFLKG